MLNGMSTFRHLLTAVLALTAAASLAASAPASAAPGIAAEAAAVRSADPALVADDWVWPVSGFRILTAYVAPAHRYAKTRQLHGRKWIRKSPHPW